MFKCTLPVKLFARLFQCVLLLDFSCIHVDFVKAAGTVIAFHAFFRLIPLV